MGTENAAAIGRRIQVKLPDPAYWVTLHSQELTNATPGYHGVAFVINQRECV
jgi:hypothetical protein